HERGRPPLRRGVSHSLTRRLAMTRDELLETLRNLELELRSGEVRALFAKGDQATRERLVSLRQEVTLLVGRLTHADLDRIASKLEELDGELPAGVKRLRTRLTALKDGEAILDSLATFLGLAARIALLAS